jgi:hypothetical protein
MLGKGHAVGFVEAFGTRRSTVMRNWSGPGFGRMSGGLAHSAPVFLYTKPSSSSSRILSRINISCGGAYLRADFRTGSAQSRSLMTRGFTFAGGSAPSLSLKTSLHYVTSCRKLCTPSRYMPACSALVSAGFQTLDSFEGVDGVVIAKMMFTFLFECLSHRGYILLRASKFGDRLRSNSDGVRSRNNSIEVLR